MEICAATIGLTIVLLVFGEITPKTLAALRPEIIAYPVSLPLLMLQKVLFPLVALLGWVSNGLLRLLGVDLSNKGNDSLSTEELRSVVRESGSDLPLNRQSMLLGILDALATGARLEKPCDKLSVAIPLKRSNGPQHWYQAQPLESTNKKMFSI